MALPPLPDVFGNYALPNFTHLAYPGAIDWWPTAPGWRVLAVLVAAWLGVAAWRRWQRWRRNRYRRDALAALRNCRKLDPEEQLQAMARILKSAALSAFPRRDIAALTGDDWVDWLDRCAAQAFSEQSRHLLAAGQYRPGDIPGAEDLTALARDCERWLVQHREPLAC